MAVTQRYGSDMSVADFVPDAMDNYVGDGTLVRATECKAVTGRKKRDRLKKLVNWLLDSKTFLYQSLVGNNATANFRAGGSFMLNSFYAGTDPTNYPLKCYYPIYVFRCCTPNGEMVDFPTSTSISEARPLIGYRLVSTKASVTATNIYYWETINPNQNNTQYNGVFPNIQGVMQQDRSAVMYAPKYRHEYTQVKVLYTNPSQLQVPLVCGFVKFNRDEYAPPDEYVNSNSNPQFQTVEALRANAGAYNVAAATKPLADNDTVQNYTAFWDKYIVERDGNPLRKWIGNNADIKQVFNWVGKPYVRTFLPIPTDQGIIQGTGGIQHIHQHTLRGRGWLNTSISAKRANVWPINDQNDSTDIAIATNSENTFSGVFPVPMNQRWFMVSAWTRGGIGASQTGIQYTPSFDITIQQKFSTFANA